MRKSCSKWFGHVHRRMINISVRKNDLIQVKRIKRGRKRSKITLLKVIKS